jgi:hypothetical protein
MAYFVIPANSSSITGVYDEDSKEGPGSVWRVQMTVGAPMEIALAFGWDPPLIVVSNNPNVIAADINNPIPLKRAEQGGQLRIYELNPKGDGGTLIQAGLKDGDKFNAWGKGMQVLASQPTAAVSSSSFINLTSPHMALNGGGLAYYYKMDSNLVIPGTDSPTQIMDKVKKGAAAAHGGKLRHLAFNCHGYVSPRIYLQLGTEITPSDVGVFTQLKGLVGVIWLCACNLASHPDGEVMCQNIANNAGCYVVACMLAVAVKQNPGLVLPAGAIEDLSAHMPKVYAPNAAPGTKNLIAFSTFSSHYATTLGFAVPKPTTLKGKATGLPGR